MRFNSLQAGQRSHWHRVDADKIWLWHAGTPQIVVPKGRRQAARTTDDDTVMSCTGTPGFQFKDFDLAAPDFDLPGVLMP